MPDEPATSCSLECREETLDGRHNPETLRCSSGRKCESPPRRPPPPATKEQSLSASDKKSRNRKNCRKKRKQRAIERLSTTGATFRLRCGQSAAGAGGHLLPHGHLRPRQGRPSGTDQQHHRLKEVLLAAERNHQGSNRGISVDLRRTSRTKFGRWWNKRSRSSTPPSPS